jgi:hypothetical protein
MTLEGCTGIRVFTPLSGVAFFSKDGRPEHIADQLEKFTVNDLCVEGLVAFLEPPDGCHDARILNKTVDVVAR